jgi:hypothetical protein
VSRPQPLTSTSRRTPPVHENEIHGAPTVQHYVMFGLQFTRGIPLKKLRVVLYALQKDY